MEPKADTCRAQVLSYGGGTQSVAMALLVLDGVLPRPDLILCADTSREATSTWEYLDLYVRPLIGLAGIKVEISSHELATVDLYSHKGTLLLPVYTATGKFRTFCSNEWKVAVNERYLRGRGIKSADSWIGYSVDESSRVKGHGESPWFRRYPLLELMLSKSDCERIILSHGMPLPPKSACYMCPHRHNVEWRFLRDNHPADFEKACVLDEEIREDDEQHSVYLHESRVPLRQANLDAIDRREPSRQCGLGNCFI